MLPKVWSAGVSVAKTPVGVGEGHHSVSLEVVQCRRRSSSVANEKTAGRCHLCHQRPHSAVKVRCSFSKGCRLPSRGQSGTVNSKGQHCTTVLGRYHFFFTLFSFSETVIIYFLVLFCLFVGVLSAPPPNPANAPVPALRVVSSCSVLSSCSVEPHLCNRCPRSLLEGVGSGAVDRRCFQGSLNAEGMQSEGRRAFIRGALAGQGMSRHRVIV